MHLPTHWLSEVAPKQPELSQFRQYSTSASRPQWKIVLDLAIIIVVFTYNLPVVINVQPPRLSLPVIILVFVGVCLPFLWRHRFPIIVFLITLAAIGLHFLLGVPISVADIMLVLCLCSLATKLQWQLTVIPLLTTLIFVIIATHQPYVAGYLSVGEIGFFITAILLSYSWGITLQLYRQHISNLRLRTVELQQAQKTREIMAKEEERKRIARELHDIVSHSLSSVVALSEGAAATINSDPEKAYKAIQLISKTGRDALGEMRTMLALLRTAGEEESKPQPTLQDLAELLDNARTTNTNISYEQSGDLSQLNPGLQLTTYRVVQEALTNVRKHAGLDAATTINIECTPARLKVIIANTVPNPPEHTVPSGYGLAGMRERVKAHGGTLEAGELPDGRFQITATIPLGEAL